MKLELPPQKLKALPVQLIDVDGGVVLKRGRTEIQIGGQQAAFVVQTLLSALAGGGATEQQLCERFAVPDRLAVENLIRGLKDKRILVPEDEAGPGSEVLETELEVFYWHFGLREDQAADRLSRQRILIVGVNGISRQLALALSASNAQSVEVVDYPLLRNLRLFDARGQLQADRWPASLSPPVPRLTGTSEIEPDSFDCLIATSDFGGQQLMREWNEFCILHNRHFLPVILQNLIGYVGPLVVPRETACFECLLLRQNSHLANPGAARAVDARAFETQAASGFHPSMASILGDVAAIELIKFYGLGAPFWKVGTLIEVNLLATHMTAHKVLRMPRCSVCTTLDVRPSATPRKNVFMAAGQAQP